MTFAQKVLSGQVKTAGIGTVLKAAAPVVGRFLKGSGSTVATGVKNLPAAGKWLMSPKKALPIAGATVGTNLVNNYMATRPSALAKDIPSVSGNFDRTIRPLVGAGMLLGAPVAAYLAAKSTQSDDDDDDEA